MFEKPLRNRLLRSLLIGLGALAVSSAVYAGEADVVAVEFVRAADGSYRFDVAVRHADEGWEHYADLWQVSGPEGTVYGERLLAHPHVNEQPFTRSQSGIVIPENVNAVTVRAHDSVHGWGGAEMTLDLGN